MKNSNFKVHVSSLAYFIWVNGKVKYIYIYLLNAENIFGKLLESRN